MSCSPVYLGNLRPIKIDPPEYSPRDGMRLEYIENREGKKEALYCVNRDSFIALIDNDKKKDGFICELYFNLYGEKLEECRGKRP